MIDNFNDINTCGLKKDKIYNLCIEGEKIRDFDFNLDGYTVGLSSGTTGQRGIFFISQKNSLKHAAFVMSKYISLLNKNKIAYFQRANSNLYEVGTSSRLQLRFFDLIFPVQHHISELNALMPNLLIAPSRVLKQLALLKKSGLLKINPEKVINIMEVLDPNDEKIIKEHFGINFVDQFYMATEGIVGLTCEKGKIHLCEELMEIKYKFEDESSRRISFKLTDLYRYEQPHINYEMTDILELADKPCSCGNASLVVDKIHGRKEDSLFFTNINGAEVEVYPDLLARVILFANENIEDYQIVQKESNLLEVFISPSTENIKNDVIKSLQSFMEDKKSVKYLKVDFMSEAITKKGKKFRRIYSRVDGE